MDAAASASLTQPGPDAAGATWAVVVARTGLSAKSRLAPVLPRASDRARLAQAMLADVLAACAGAGLAGTLVVTDTGAAWRTAWRAGARPLLDPGFGLNAAVRAGLGAARRIGARSALVLPGDVPLARAADVRSVVAAAGNAPRAAVVVLDHAGSGTNALLVRPPDLIEPAFGIDSGPAHLAAARAAGATVVAQRADAGLGLDVDTPTQLARLRDLGLDPSSATGTFLDGRI